MLNEGKYVRKESIVERIVVGMSGASGAILGIRLLEMLGQSDYEVHLVMSKATEQTIKLETDWKVEDVLALADVVHDFRDIGAPIASGSFRTMGMAIVPCSMKTMSALANSFNTNLLIRAADVTLKERFGFDGQGRAVERNDFTPVYDFLSPAANPR